MGFLLPISRDSVSKATLTYPFRDTRLCTALKATFTHRNTAFSKDGLPAALMEEFVQDPAKQRQWNSFVGKALLKKELLKCEGKSMLSPGDDQEVFEKQRMSEMWRALEAAPIDELKSITEKYLRKNLDFFVSSFANAQKVPDEVIALRTNRSIDEVSQKWESIRSVSPEALADQAFAQLEEMSAEDLKTLLLTQKNRFSGNSLGADQ